jgi:hypothetical protein
VGSGAENVVREHAPESMMVGTNGRFIRLYPAPQRASETLQRLEAHEAMGSESSLRPHCLYPNDTGEAVQVKTLALATL